MRRSVDVAGKTLADPQEPLEKQLAVVLEELYQTRTTSSRDGLVQFFLDSEDAYFQQRDKGACVTGFPKSNARLMPPVSKNSQPNSKNCSQTCALSGAPTVSWPA